MPMKYLPNKSSCQQNVHNRLTDIFPDTTILVAGKYTLTNISTQMR